MHSGSLQDLFDQLQAAGTSTTFSEQNELFQRVVGGHFMADLLGRIFRFTDHYAKIHKSTGFKRK